MNDKTHAHGEMTDDRIAGPAHGGLDAVAEPEYRAFRTWTREGPLWLFFVFRNDVDYLILSYDDLASIANPPGVDPNTVVLLRFRGPASCEVRIEGRRLLAILAGLWRRQISSLKEAPEGWEPPAGAEATVITRIVVRETGRDAARGGGEAQRGLMIGRAGADTHTIDGTRADRER